MTKNDDKNRQKLPKTMTKNDKESPKNKTENDKNVMIILIT